MCSHCAISRVPWCCVPPAASSDEWERFYRYYLQPSLIIYTQLQPRYTAIFRPSTRGSKAVRTTTWFTSNWVCWVLLTQVKAKSVSSGLSSTQSKGTETLCNALRWFSHSITCLNTQKKQKQVNIPYGIYRAVIGC